MRQDKSRSVTILVPNDYIQKSVSMLNTSKFRKIDTILTKSLERKVQQTLRKIKHKFEEMSIKGVLLKSPTIDPPTHGPLSTYRPTHRPLTHRPTDRSSSTCTKAEDQVLNMFCNL